MQRASKWLVFVLVAIAQFMVVLDSAITNVALPTIKMQLGFSNDSLQWVVTAYALTFGGFLLLGGRAADLFGRRRVLLVGMTGFTVFSFLIGISNSAVALITLRTLQGAAAALMSPAALSIVLTTFRDGPVRNKALAYWTLVATAGAAIGLLLGGILTQYVGWRWNFFINVPVGIVMFGLIRFLVPKHEGANENRSLDLPGAILATGGLMTLVLGISQAPVWGWTAVNTLGTFSLGLALIMGFVLNELRAKHPLVPLGIFKTRNVTGANLMMAPMYATMLGLFYIVTLYFQTILGYSPFETGLAFLPMPIILGLMSTRISGLVNRYGFKRLLVTGPIIVGLGLLYLSKLPIDGHYLVNVLPGLILMPIGIGLTFMPVISAATSGVPGEQAGLASGLISTSQQMGGAVGLAVLSGVAAATTTGSLYLGKVGALVHGFDQGIVAGIGFVGFAALLGAFVITKPKRQTPRPNEQEPQAVPRRQPRIQLG